MEQYFITNIHCDYNNNFKDPFLATYKKDNYHNYGIAIAEP